MILSIHQPSYFPWLGLLHKIASSDRYMVMDEVQLTDSAYQHRNLFLSADGKVKFLTIPFNRKEYLRRSFRELEIRDQSWRTDHLNFIRNGYRKHPFFDEIFPILTGYYAQEYFLLIDAVLASMRISLDLFGITTGVIRQSDCDYDRSLTRGDLVISLAAQSGADCYLSGLGANAYLDPSAFPANIALLYDHFEHPRYDQINSPEFVPGLSCLDLLFNLGTSASRGILAESLLQ